MERLFGKRRRKYLISPKACIWGSSLAHIAQEYSCALASCYRMMRVHWCSMREGLLPFFFFFSLEKESAVFHFQSPNIPQRQNKGKAEPESSLLILISLLCSLQGKVTDEQQMQGNTFLPPVLLLSGCLSLLQCCLDGAQEPNFHLAGTAGGFSSNPSSPPQGCGGGSSWTCCWAYPLANTLLQNSGRVEILHHGRRAEPVPARGRLPGLAWSRISHQCCRLPPFHPQLLAQQHLG